MASLIWPGDRLSEEELRQQHQELGLIPGWVDTSGNRYADNILRQGLLPQVDAYTEASKSPHPSGWPTAPYMHDSFATHPSQMADFGEIARRSLQSPETHVADSNLPSDVRAARQKNVVENLDQRLQEIENPSLLGFGMPEISYGTVGENPFNGIIPIAGNDPEAPYGSMGGWAQAFQGAPNMFADYGEAFRQAGLWDQPKETQKYLDMPTTPVTQDAPWNFVSDELTGLGTEGGPTKTGFGSIADQVAKDYAFPFLTGQEFSPYDQAQKTVEDFLANELITSDEANRIKGHQLASLNPVVNAAQAILYQPIDQWLDDRTQRPGTPAVQSILDGIKAGTQNILGTYSPGDTPVTAAYELMNEGYRSPAQIRASIPDMVSQVDSFSTRPTPGIDEAIINESAYADTTINPNITVEKTIQEARERERVAEEQRVAEQQAYDAQIAQAAAQAVAEAARVEQAAQRASTPAGAQDIRSQVDTFTSIAPPPVVTQPILTIPSRPPDPPPVVTKKTRKPGSAKKKKAKIKKVVDDQLAAARAAQDIARAQEMFRSDRRNIGSVEEALASLVGAGSGIGAGAGNRGGVGRLGSGPLGHAADVGRASMGRAF